MADLLATGGFVEAGHCRRCGWPHHHRITTGCTWPAWMARRWPRRYWNACTNCDLRTEVHADAEG